jgi:TonB-linked SusC/RagA family outer membrane protein
MHPGFSRTSIRAAILALALVASSAASAAAQSGSLSGLVAAEGSNAPIADARVIVVGTNLFTVTAPDGRYTIRNISAGAYDIRVLRVGYQEQKKALTLAPGQSATLDFTMAQAVVKLQEVVTTATGEQRRVELGNAVATVNAAQRATESPVTDIASLLVAQAPGVQVMPGNTVGTGARVRIRGNSSLSLVNDPIYVIDGVRMRSDNGSQSGNIFTGGAIQSRAQDINPDEIENIEIVKGPSAATLYGTDAANGVIVITTKRGRSGQTRYNVSAENGIIKDYNTWPTAYTLTGHAPTGSTRNCATPSLTQVSAGLCVADSLRKFNLFEDPNTTPLGTGFRHSANAQISGGTQVVRFFTSGQYEDEAGVLKIPNFDIQRLDTMHVTVRPEWRRPNELTRGTFRANVDASPSPKLDASFSSGFITSRSRLPQSDNNALGLLSNGFGGPGFEHGRTSTLGFDLHGYRQSTPAESFQDVATQYINRFIGSTNLNYRPTSWLAARMDAGVDYTARWDQQLCRRGNCADVGTTRLGFVQDDRTGLREVTVNGLATGTFNPLAWLNSKTTAGVQWVTSTFDRNGAGAQNLPPGAQTLSAGATQITDGSTDDNKTLGLFAEEQVGIRDRLFVTGAVRSDQNSAFGTKFQRVVYPKGSISYLISDEGWFPRLSFLNQLRLRMAYGASGVQPGSNDALRYYTPTTINVALVDQPGLFYTSLGNEQLRPERATEFETGFETRLFSSRTNVEVTYYSKLTKDALIGAVIPPTLGTGNTTQRSNLGSVKNTGLEAMINSQIVDLGVVAWDVTLSGSQNDNKLVSLGFDAQGRPLPNQIGTTTANIPGLPLFSWYQRQVTSFTDRNGDGIITLDEITVQDTSTYVGRSQPKYEMVFTNGLDLFNHQLRVVALFDRKAGYKQLNGTERIRCGSRNNCFEVYDKSAPLWRQARAVALREHASRTQAGYMEDASFTRFRELTLTYQVPERFLGRSRFAKTASLNFAARNLHVWTNYTGIDPESNADAGSTASVASDFQTVPPPTYFIFRLNLGF